MNIYFRPYKDRRLEGLIPPRFGEYIYGQTGKCNRVFDGKRFVLCEASDSDLISEVYLFEIAKFCGTDGTDYYLMHEALYEMTEAMLHEIFHQIYLYNKEYIREDEVKNMAELLVTVMREMSSFGRKPRRK